mmetsp:Transcript_13084/g.28382  ORF Transcript_13084/g.28382 Transcript_13084/m.28382 type:complete len:111 (-) Transcript_13084:627-959(-)|eukprot:CAMPEP_0178509474 /NCGR_PEP_ID=MMETSP0696-20121128/21308_1 /TAXON_ID=265572 /ORGANISM="Extubocellulus spinifer, Strain CCMP396" /LENGTH=110 /DNA_ID=CAMNT_0020139103 /DNA_START=690 /DNA_END=1022 /DNA_ORIENTATION=+
MSGLFAEEDEDRMSAYLADKGQDVPATATYLRVLSYFEKIGSCNFDFFEKDAKVKYPILPTSAISIIERIKAVKVEDFCDMINGDAVEMDTFVSIIHIYIGVDDSGARTK